MSINVLLLLLVLVSLFVFFWFLLQVFAIDISNIVAICVCFELHT